MGLCTSKKSIEEIIHSKYTLAKDATQKLHKNEFQHVYVWRYTSDDLAEKEVRFYDCENESLGMMESMKGNVQNVENCGEENLGEEYLSGKPVEWPITCHADEGYIVLTIKNFTKELQVLTKENKKIKKHSSQLQENCIEHLCKLQIPLEISEILYMINLDEFHPYFYTRIPQYNNDLEFTAEIEIIVGDLVEKIDCLKLVTIAYELEKYLQRGGQNVLKMLYNEYEYITYLIVKGNCEEEEQENGLEKINTINNNREVLVEGEIMIERIFGNEIETIMKSKNYTNEKEKEFQVRKLIMEFVKVVKQFNVLSNVFFGGFNLKNFNLLELEHQNNKGSKKYSKVVLNTEVSKGILELCKNSSSINSNKDNKTVNIFQTIKRKNLSTLTPIQQQKFPENGKSSNMNQAEEDELNEISVIEVPKGKEMNFCKSKGEYGDLMNTSSPFVCEITEIDGMRGGLEYGAERVSDNVRKMQQKIEDDKNRVNKIIQHQGNVEESLLLPKELEQLNTSKVIYPITIPQTSTTEHEEEYIQPQILITSYAGTSQFHELKRLNVSLVINMSPWECYNYFINDFEYDWFWVERFGEEEEEKVGENDKWRLNISCLAENVVHRIERHLEYISTQQQNTLVINKQTHQLAKAIIFCSHTHLIYSGTIAVVYLMLHNSHKLPFEHAYNSVKESTSGKFIMPKVYEEQLRDLEGRVNQLSSVGNINAVNMKVSSYKAYEIGMYTVMDNTLIVGRYVGEINSSNQLQILHNNTLKSYLLIPNNFTTIIIKSINILRDDTELLTSDNNVEKIGNVSKLIKNMGLILRFFYGKEQTNEQKKVYFNFVQEQLLLQLVRYEYINFPKKLFNVQKYKSKIELIIESLKSLITSEPIEKSFRKPQPFDQEPISLVNDISLLKLTPSTEKTHRNQPFNSKEILTFKYPILRPIFESKKKDNYYVIIKKFKEDDTKDKQMGCNVTFYKGENWIGLEEDKERFFEKIVYEYLSDINEERIWIEDEESCTDQSLFDRDSILF